MEIKEYGDFTFEVPDYVIHRNKKYMRSSSYTLHKDVAEKWAKHTNEIGFRHMVVKSFPSKQVVRRVGHKKLYVLFKRTIKEPY
jgi:hypothetical protein